MDERELTVDLFCRVVDNYGDIGVVWRLTRHLRTLRPRWHLRLTVSDLEVFRSMEPRINPSLPVQNLEGVEIFAWYGQEAKAGPPPQVAVENFGEGWPTAFGEKLMDPSDSRPRLAVNVDYLSAEDYAQEYHRLPSLTPQPQVKKFFFMPGFTASTGGLLLGNDFRRLAFPANSEACTGARLDWLKEVTKEADLQFAQRFWLSLFTYEHDFRPLVEDLTRWNRPLLLLLPEGRGKAGFLRAWQDAGQPFPVLKIPFLPQQTYDRMVGLCDFNLVRGEESLVRACVSGRPFLWHAYLQDEGYHRVKVEALLDRMKPCFPQPEVWEAITRLFLEFNHRLQDSEGHGAAESFSSFFELWPAVSEGFRRFSDSLWKNGDLAENLAEFIEDTLPVL